MSRLIVLTILFTSIFTFSFSNADLYFGTETELLLENRFEDNCPRRELESQYQDRLSYEGLLPGNKIYFEERSLFAILPYSFIINNPSIEIFLSSRRQRAPPVS